MNKSFMEHYKKRRNRHYILALLGLLLIVGALVYQNQKPLMQYLEGPVTVSYEELHSSIDLKEYDYIKMIPEEISGIFASYVQNMQMFMGLEEAENELMHYHLANIENLFIIVQTDPNVVPGHEIAGKFIQVPSELMVLATSSELMDWEDTIFPYMLDATSDIKAMKSASLYFIVPLLILLFVGLSYFIYFSIVAEKHPVYKDIRKIGDPLEIAEAIDKEIRAGAERRGKYYITENWIIRVGRFSFRIARNYFEDGATYYLDNIF